MGHDWETARKLEKPPVIETDQYGKFKVCFLQF